MSNSSEIATFYSSVIRTVIQEIRQEFINMGVDEQTLFDLQTTWEQKLMAARVFDPSDYPTGQRDFPPLTGGFMYQREDLVGMPQMMSQMTMPPYPTQFTGGFVSAQPIRLPPTGGVPQPFFHPTPMMTSSQIVMPQRPPMPTMPIPPPPPAPMIPPRNQHLHYDEDDDDASRPTHIIPQVDGADDDVDEPLVVSTTVATAAVAQVTKDEDELGSDLDDEDDVEDEEQDVDDLLLCLYEKVNRTRNKWKCNFKSGIVTIKGRDYAFSRLNGDFEW